MKITGFKKYDYTIHDLKRSNKDLIKLGYITAIYDNEVSDRKFLIYYYNERIYIEELDSKGNLLYIADDKIWNKLFDYAVKYKIINF